MFSIWDIDHLLIIHFIDHFIDHGHYHFTDINFNGAGK